MKLLTALSIFLLLAIFAYAGIFPLGAYETLKTFMHRDDPVAIATYGLGRVDADEFKLHVQTAIDKGDFALATELISLAETYGHELPESLTNAANPDIATRTASYARNAIEGAITGKFENSSGLTGAIISDLTGAGDVRDLVVQGKAAIQGKEYDTVVLALAATGVFLTGSVILSGGAASPADTGVSIMKNAYKSGHISKPLLTHIRRSADGLVDMRKLKSQLSEFDNLKPSKAKVILGTSIDPGRMNVLTDLSRNVGNISSNADIGTALQALRISENSAELAKTAKLSTHFGKQSRAVLAVLGRGALVATGLFVSFAFWLAAAICWLVTASWITFKFFRLFLSPLRKRA